MALTSIPLQPYRLAYEQVDYFKDEIRAFILIHSRGLAVVFAEDVADITQQDKTTRQFFDISCWYHLMILYH